MAHTYQDDFNTEQLQQNAKLEDEIRRLSLRLQRSESGKSQFLSNVRNEINNPMASIIGLAASIAGMSTEEKVKRMSTLIQKQATELDFQMRNIIMAAEIELGTMYPSASRVNLNSLVEDQVNYFNHRMTEHNVKVTVTMQDHLRFKTDSQMLQAICLNVIANAIEFCGARKQVDIEVRIISEHLEIVVIDSGAGLTAAQQTEIFQRFGQLESGACKKHRGHGLGLSIVNELVNHLQGTLSIDSHPETGTKVKIRIPELMPDSQAATCSSNGNESLFTTDEEF